MSDISVFGLSLAGAITVLLRLGTVFVQCADEATGRGAVRCCYGSGEQAGTCAASVCDAANGGTPAPQPTARGGGGGTDEAMKEWMSTQLASLKQEVS